MSATGFIDACGFIPASSGTGNFVVSSAITGYQTPASAGAVNGTVYSYRAESADKSQWEEGFGAYTVSSTTLARTTITANSSGGTTAIAFSAAPNVFITALSADLAGLVTGNYAQSLNTTQQGQARTNINAAALPGAWTAYTPTASATSGTLTTAPTTGSYLQLGKLVFFTAQVTLTAIGTASGRINLGLPVTAGSSRYVVVGVEAQATGDTITGLIQAGGVSALIDGSAGTSPNLVVNGNVLLLSGCYESA